MTSYAMDVVNLNSILNFFNEFTNANDTNSGNKENIIHRVGTVESQNFSNRLLKIFQDFGLKEVSNLYSISLLQQQIIWLWLKWQVYKFLLFQAMIEPINKSIPGSIDKVEISVRDINNKILWNKTFDSSSDENQVF